MLCALLELLHLEAKNPPVSLVHLSITRAEIKRKISLRVLYIWNSVPLDVDVKGLKALGSLFLSELYTHISNLKLCVFASRSSRRHKSSFAWLTNFLAKWAWNFHDTAKQLIHSLLNVTAPELMYPGSTMNNWFAFGMQECYLSIYLFMLVIQGKIYQLSWQKSSLYKMLGGIRPPTSCV